MLVATNPAIRCRPSRRSLRPSNCRSVVSIDGSANDQLTGSWYVVAGNVEIGRAGVAGQSKGMPSCLCVVRADRRSLRDRIFDRLSGRGRFRVLWQDDDRGYCVIARPDRNRVLILSRAPHMQTRDLFQRVADLRQRGFDTRTLHYAHVD